ncbi:MAG: DUF885 domain-containing protein [Verrucomicrobiales bacterium]|nr:DUF885 domain-containing protein [Verrucomicrobiales bacterium]|tara:strand:+ start:255 stop:2006 length:1752 start_codon:yes stop_codon:yes gene_type:complete
MKFLNGLCFAMLLLPIPVSAAPSESQRLHDLFDREWDYHMQRRPMWASILGDRRWNDRWPDMSRQGTFKHELRQKRVMIDLHRLDRSKLSSEDQLNYDLFEQSLQRDIEDLSMMLYLMPLDHRHGVQTMDEYASALRFETVKDYEDWIKRLEGLPVMLDQITELMREGIARGIVHSRVVMERVPRQLAKHIVEEPEHSPFYKPFRKFHRNIPEGEQLRMESEAWTAIKEDVVPAFQKFKVFFVEKYLPGCHSNVGAWQWPHGKRAYDFLCRKFTTTSSSADQIHKTGLSEVQRIRGEMDAIREKVGFKGSLAEFFDHLRTDPKFFYRTGDELLQGYRAMSRRIDPLMVKVFRVLPRMPYGIEPIPAKTAPDTTTAYYRWPAPDGSRAGTYFVNLYMPETRPKWEMMALSLHEAVPGHHLQIALAQEQNDLPKFRRHLSVTAYIEGWGLYAESLGDELGLYDDPYDKFGQLTYEMWRAVRLVVDTGMHSKKWSRDKAIEFFMENAPKTRQDVVNEIDRYIAWPGQALAYKIGQLKLSELRATASKALGAEFDVKAFHDVVLQSGAVPLDILTKRINAWIRAGGK